MPRQYTGNSATIPHLYAHTCPTCAGKGVPIASEQLPRDYNFEQHAEQVLKELFSQEKPSSGLLTLTGKTLADKVQDSYTHITPDFTTPDTAMLAQLTSDVWQFSAAKNWQEMRDLTLLLKDENGKLREWADFKEAARSVIDKYQTTWMRSEYNFAVSASQSAARWTEFEKEKDAIPNLKYQTVGDDAVRPEHQLLDGIIRPKTDPWWNTHYPPNGWGCRCEAVEVPNGLGRITPDDRVPVISIPKMFRTNLAETGLLFPKNHPYYNGIPKAELRKAIAWLDPEDTYQSYVIGNYEIQVHPLHGKKELEKNIEACNALLHHDPEAKIKLLPILNEQDAAIRLKFYPKEYIEKYPNKNADMIYNGKVVEIEVPNGSKSSIQNAIKKGKQQSDIVFIHLNDLTDFNKAVNTVNGQLKHYEDKENLRILVFNSKRKQEFSVNANHGFKPVKTIDEAIIRAKSLGIKNIEFADADINSINSVLSALNDEQMATKHLKLDDLIFSNGSKMHNKTAFAEYQPKTSTTNSGIYINTKELKRNNFTRLIPFDEQLKVIDKKIEN